ncbi:MAG: sigma-70 family RNA polymerase sigma factor [Cyanobacteria bacterium P01_H01_bin.21]
MSEPPNDPFRAQVEKAQGYPANSRERLNALRELIQLLKQSGQLARPYKDKFKGFYQQIYDDALNRTFAFVCDRIDTYSPEIRPVIAWVNFYLCRRYFPEASREFMRTRHRGVGADVDYCSLTDLDVADPSTEDGGTSLLDDLIGYIEEDPGDVFKHHHVQGHPNANFQYIALQRLKYRTPWDELAAELGVSAQTLSSLYHRGVKRYQQQIRDDLR